MASYTLDDIRSAAEQKYSSTDITIGDTVCKLVNPLRLPKEKRKALSSIQSNLSSEEGEEETDQADVFADAIRTVCETEAQADVLLGAIGDDLAMLATIFETYGKAQQVGEASASAS